MVVLVGWLVGWLCVVYGTPRKEHQEGFDLTGGEGMSAQIRRIMMMMMRRMMMDIVVVIVVVVPRHERTRIDL